MPWCASRRRTIALGTAAGYALGAIGAGVLGLGFQATHDRDATILQGLTGLAPDRLYDQIRVLALIVDPVPYACLGLACIGVAFARGRRQRALAAGVVLLGSGATTQLLKHLLAEPRYAAFLRNGQVDGASWPSGHGTAVMTIALVAVLVTPPAYRTAVGFVGFCTAVTVAFATLALTWHYPSDVTAGFFIAGIWVSLAIVWLQGAEIGDPEPETLPPFGWLVAAGGACVLVAGAAVWVASSRVQIDVTGRLTATAGALVIASLALVLVIATLVGTSVPPTRGETRSRQART